MVIGLIVALAGTAVIGLTLLFERGITYGTTFAATANIPQNRYGVDTELDKIVNPADVQRSLDMIAAAGFGFIRQTFDWDEIEISAKGDFYDHKNNKSAWDKYDAIVNDANAHGLQVIARLERPPAWARPAGSQPTAPPSNLNDYGDYVAAFVQHFKGRVHYIQIWNEPNRYEDWGDQPVDPAAYTKLLQIAYTRAKQVDPSITVLSAALTPTTDCCTKNRPDPVYLQEMYDAGARGSFDILGAQAYGLRAGPEDPAQDLPLHPNAARKAVIDSHNTNFGRLVLDRQVMVRNGDGAKPVWVSEFGWNALPAGWTGDTSPWGSVTPATQAEYTVAALQRAQREWPWLGVMNLWLFQDPSPAPRDPTQFFGLVGPDFQPRPVFTALAAFMHQHTAAPTGLTFPAPPRALFAGAWQVDLSRPAFPRISPVSGASVSFKFEGSAVALDTARGPNMGIAYVTIDGSPTYVTDIAKDSAGRAAIDLYAPGASTTRLSLASGLPYGVHTVKVTVSGLKQAASRGPAVEIDGFVAGITRDERPFYVGGALLAAGLLLIAWQVGSWVLEALAHPSGFSGRADGAFGSLRLTGAPDGLLARPASGVQLVTTGLALAILYFGRPWPVAILGGILALAAAIAWLDVALVFVPLAAPFYLQPIHIRSADIPLSEALIGICLAAYLIRTAWRGAWSWPSTSFRWPALLFFAAATASVFAAQYPRYALREWRTDILEPLIFFGLIVLVRPRVRWLVNSLLAAGAIVALAGVVQYARHRGIEAEGVLRMVGVYFSPDNFALFLGRIAPLAAALALLSPGSWKRRLPYLAVAGLSLIGVLLSFTRGAWLGTGVALLIVAAFAGRRWLAAALAAAAVAAVGLGSVQARRIQSIFQLTPGSTTFSRLELWRSTVHMIGDHPWLGVGLDNFLYQYPRYILPQARNEPDLSHPHNLVLDFWSRIGIFGLASLVWLEVVFFGKLARLLPKARGYERAVAVGLLASMVDCLVHGLVDNSYFLIDLSLIFWLSLGLVELLQFGDSSQPGEAP